MHSLLKKKNALDVTCVLASALSSLRCPAVLFLTVQLCPTSSDCSLMTCKKKHKLDSGTA